MTDHRAAAQPAPFDLAAAIAEGDTLRLAVRTALTGRRITLPLRYWLQSAHLTAPATDAAMARKAVEGGTASVARMLERLGLTGDDLADRLEISRDLVGARLA
nr:hypothetical protein [Chloroflexota bacterium]